MKKTSSLSRTVASCPWSNFRSILRGLKEIPVMRTSPLNYFTGKLQQNRVATSYHLGLERIVMLNHSDSIRYVMVENSNNYTKGTFYQSLRSVLGGGILMTEADIWLAQRRASAPQFTGMAISKMADRIADATEDVLSHWDEKLVRGDNKLMACQEMMHITISTVTEALFNIRLSRIQQEKTYRAFAAILKAAENRIWSIVKWPLALDEMFNPLYTKAIPILTDLADEIIAGRKAVPNGEDDLLNRIIIDSEKRNRPYKELRDEVITMLVAGYEAPSVSLCWTHWLLALNPQVANRLYAEVDEVLGGRKPVYEDIEKLAYTRAVFDEVLRLYPPLWTVSRTALNDDNIPLTNGEHAFIPSGSHVMICPYAMHRHPDYWDDPESFNPDRFLQADRKHDRYSYIPFGGGPRNCLGDRFARMELVMVIAMIAQRYRLELLPGQSVTPTAMTTLRPATDFILQMKRRTGSPHMENARASTITGSDEGNCPFLAHHKDEVSA